MLCFRSPFAMAIAILFAGPVCWPVAGQCQETPNNFSNKTRMVPAPVEPAPFAITRPRRDSVSSVKFENADQLPQQDRLLIANAESTITELAGSAGLGIGESGWDYQEIACPSFPNHIFLGYSRDKGRGDISMFSASIPRNGAGKIRVVPILKRSYSLFSPAPINAMTISAFDHIRAEEGQSANDDWLGNALCYAALAGARPEIVPAGSWPTRESPIPSLSAALNIQFNTKGREVITFVDSAARPHAMEWAMTFTREGRLIKATHRPAELMRAKPVAETSATIRGSRIP